MPDNPYSVLGVSQDASEDDIKAAYRTLAKRYHPDLHPGDSYCARKMNEINAAYDSIKNPDKAAASQGAYQNAYQSAAYGQNAAYGQGSYAAYDFYDIFRSAYGFDPRQTRQTQPRPRGGLGRVIFVIVALYFLTRVFVFIWSMGTAVYTADGTESQPPSYGYTYPQTGEGQPGGGNNYYWP